MEQATLAPRGVRKRPGKTPCPDGGVTGIDISVDAAHWLSFRWQFGDHKSLRTRLKGRY
jgi:hypothetical protein